MGWYEANRVDLPFGVTRNRRSAGCCFSQKRAPSRWADQAIDQ